MRTIKTAVIGAGFMGKTHTEAIRRLGNVDVVAMAAWPAKDAETVGAMFGIPKTTGDWQLLVEDKEIEAVHICTPNALHCPMSMAFLAAGKHVLCEKPLAMSSAEARQMVELANQKGLVHAVNHNLRYYPLVQHIRRMIEAGELGEILSVQGTYSQDWLLYDTDYNWRLESKENGAVRAIGDIGSHWMDMVQHLTGLKITALCADLQTFHKTRKKPKVAIETFAGKNLQPEDYDEVPIDTDDFGAVLLRLGDRARGAYTVSQAAAGNKNRLQMEIYGTKAGVIWNQENPNEMWMGFRNSPNHLVLKDPSLLRGDAASFADAPGGHAEGYPDAHKQLFRRFYRKIADPSAEINYPTFEDGARGMMLLEKVLQSHQSRAWVDTV